MSIALFAAVPAVFPIRGQEASNHLIIAQKILRAAFPELSGDVSIVVDSKIDGEWSRANPVRLTVHRFDPTARNHSRDVVAAVIEIRRDGAISHATFYGDYIKSDLQGVYEFVRKKDGRREASVVAELQRRGVKYLPLDEAGLLNALNLTRLSPSLGTIQQTRARLVALPVNESVEPDFTPFWSLSLTSALPSGQSVCYSLLADPLSLRIRRIRLVDCDAR